MVKLPENKKNIAKKNAYIYFLRAFDKKKFIKE